MQGQAGTGSPGQAQTLRAVLRGAGEPPGRGGREAAGWTLSFSSETVGRLSLEIFMCHTEQTCLPGPRFCQDSLDDHKYVIIHVQCASLSRREWIIFPISPARGKIHGRKGKLKSNTDTLGLHTLAWPFRELWEGPSAWAGILSAPWQ